MLFSFSLRLPRCLYAQEVIKDKKKVLLLLSSLTLEVIVIPYYPTLHFFVPLMTSDTKTADRMLCDRKFNNSRLEVTFEGGKSSKSLTFAECPFFIETNKHKYLVVCIKFTLICQKYVALGEKRTHYSVVMRVGNPY